MTMVEDITEKRRLQRIAEEIRFTRRECLLREIHHRVKNNLQIISSLLSLADGACQNDAKYTAMLKESQNRVETMSMIHEMLYQGTELATCDFRAYAQKLITHLAQSYGKEQWSP